jgi:hypothetical protein
MLRIADLAAGADRSRLVTIDPKRPIDFRSMRCSLRLSVRFFRIRKPPPANRSAASRFRPGLTRVMTSNRK